MKIIKTLAVLALAGVSMPASAQTSALETETVAKHAAVSRRAAAEAMVLLKNGGALPLGKGSTVAIFGATEYLSGGGGSSNLKAIRVVDIPAGLREAGFSIDQGSRETAIFIVTRMAKEGSDSDWKLFNLTKEESGALAKIKADGFRRIVVICNCGHAINLKPLADDPAVGAILWTWFPGGEGGAAVADILSGAVNPSGRLAATFASNPRDWPADWPGGGNWQASRTCVPYEDDIFVGYRYFETIPGAKKKVVYPFGHGLSYTDFRLQTLDVRSQGSEVQTSVRVTNVGKVAGRRSVLCYTSQKGGKAEHPALELRAYAKTRLLAPGESETLTMSFDKADLAYFDDEGASGRPGSWVIDGGEYTVWVGGSVRDIAKTGAFQLKEAILSSPGFKLQASSLARRLRADGSVSSYPVTYPGAPIRGKGPKPREKAVDNPSVTLFDVADGKATLDDLLDQMTLKEMLSLLYGHERRDSHGGTGSIGANEKFGISAAQTCDGPAGVKRRQASTYFPCAALLACTFDAALLEEIGSVIGTEAAEVDFDILLAPGLCIHRHPLCGRNFEYFSEDPLVSGISASAYVKGVQSHGVGATLKHFAGNNREHERRIGMDIVSERAFREIYLRGFERAVKTSDPWAIMTGYNAVNGFQAGANYGLVTGILRDEWGYKGVTMTDWRTAAPMWREILAGNDVKMPTDLSHPVAGFLKKGDGVEAASRCCLSFDQVRESAKRVCRLVMKTRRFERERAALKK